MVNIYLLVNIYFAGNHSEIFWNGEYSIRSVRQMKAQAYVVPVVVLKFCSTSFFLWVRKFMADEFGEPIEESMAGTHWRKSDLQWSFSPYAKPTSFFVRKSGNVWIVSLWLFFFKFWKYYPFFIQTWLVRFSFLQFCHFFLVPKNFLPKHCRLYLSIKNHSLKSESRHELSSTEKSGFILIFYLLCNLLNICLFSLSIARSIVHL